MLDAEDRDLVLTWSVRVIAATAGVLWGTTLLALAVRLFLAVSGVK